MKTRLYTIILLVFLSACSGLNKLSLYNLSQQYSNTEFTVLDAVAFNDGGQSTHIYVPVFMTDMVTTNDEASGKNYRKAALQYELFETYESKQILDSAIFLVIDSTLYVDDTIIAIDIQYPDKKKYILKLELTDLNRVDAVSHYMVLDNSSQYSSDNYLMTDTDGDIFFTNILSEQDEVSIRFSDTLADKLYVRYYNRDFPLALPPFLEDTETNFDYMADSIFVFHASKGCSPVFHLPKEGFYHFQADSNQRSGFTVYRFHSGFPEIVTQDQMLGPLRYITTLSEYDEMQNSDDIKLAVDNFWLDNAGSPIRARSMIQKFYGRVVDANNYFTSYHEGWKTDRGLVYIVYGPPKIVYRGKDIEEWLYGEKGNPSSIRMQFVKVINPFSENDYSLIKSPSYKEKWYNIVSTWRR